LPVLYAGLEPSAVNELSGLYWSGRREEGKKGRREEGKKGRREEGKKGKK